MGDEQMDEIMDEMISNNSRLYLRVLIDRASNLFLTARQKEFAPYEVTPPQGSILFLLANIGHKATLAELARHSRREINTISLQMSTMERDGLIKKTRVKPKSTLLVFELTEKGADIHKKLSKMTADKTIMSALTEKERQQAIALVKKIISRTEKYIINQLESTN
jgi:DNA-binding MarR family transcriptional regulator